MGTRSTNARTSRRVTLVGTLHSTDKGWDDLRRHPPSTYRSPYNRARQQPRLFDNGGHSFFPLDGHDVHPGHARDLSYLISEAKDQDIRVIFVQKQFSKQSAEAVADAIGGKVVQIDPLSPDYLNNMRQIAQTLAEVLK